MGMSVGGGGGLTSEPNVVPMIDIMLVLLIIFMIMQPLVRKAIDLQIPTPNPTVMPANSKSDQIVLEVLPEGKLAINKQDVSKEQLAEKLKEIYDPRPEKVLFIKGDPKVLYQDIIWTMDVSRGSGVKVIGIPPIETKK
ncbi:MAG TPA: biopolymer transporter ExbD [Gemmatimonadaceae bacterium]|nr:biopolymer transporter ExbD [Gemmatimonadaceae bacterium]